MTTKIRSAYSPRQRVQVTFPGKSLTEQSHAKSSNINAIIDKYHKTGVIEFENKYQPLYGEIPSMDLAEAYMKIQKAEGMFQELPSRLRKQFENDPVKLLSFVQDQANASKMVEIGLATEDDYPAELLAAQRQAASQSTPGTIQQTEQTASTSPSEGATE